MLNVCNELLKLRFVPLVELKLRLPVSIPCRLGCTDVMLGFSERVGVARWTRCGCPGARPWVGGQTGHGRLPGRGPGLARSTRLSGDHLQCVGSREARHHRRYGSNRLWALPFILIPSQQTELNLKLDNVVHSLVIVRKKSSNTRRIFRLLEAMRNWVGRNRPQLEQFSKLPSIKLKWT